jgi:hypothetical protein
MVQPDRPQMRIWRMRIACWITMATDTLRICNTYCFCTETVVTRMRRSVTLCLHCLSCAFHDVLSQNVDLGSVCKAADQVLSQYLSGVTEQYTMTQLMIANVPRTRFETGIACIQAVAATQTFIMETNCVFCETAFYNGDELCFL